MDKKVLLIVLFAFLGIWAFLDSIGDRLWIFNPNKLQQIAKQNIAKKLPSKELFKAVVADLEKEYPGHINLEEKWIFNNAAGAMGHMWIVHASITEYIIIFGTPIGTEGHSGRHMADDYFIILEGEQWAYSAGELDKEIFRPGEMHLMKRGDAKGYRMDDKTYALEYARGWVPSMFPVGVADTIFSTFDLPTLFDLTKLYAKSIIKNLLLFKL